MNLMRTWQAVAMTLLLACAPAAAREDDPEPRLTAREALRKAQGEWEIASLTENGADLRKELDADTVVITKDQAVIKGKARHEEVVLRLDTKKYPPHVDVLHKGDKGPPSRGIFKFGQGTLTIVLGPPNRPRPTKFDDKAATKFVLRRAKAKD
jgi:uncharacterized protein (TIGR03067 family)